MSSHNKCEVRGAQCEKPDEIVFSHPALRMTHRIVWLMVIEA